MASYIHRTVNDERGHYTLVQDLDLFDTNRKQPRNEFVSEINAVQEFVNDKNVDDFILSGLDSTGDANKSNGYVDRKQRWKDDFTTPVLQLKSQAKPITFPDMQYYKGLYQKIIARKDDVNYFLKARTAFAEDFIRTLDNCCAMNNIALAGKNYSKTRDI